MTSAPDDSTVGGIVRPVEVAPDQGYHEHAAPNRDEERERRPVATRMFLARRAFWLAAGILAVILLVGFFIWIWLGPR